MKKRSNKIQLIIFLIAAAFMVNGCSAVHNELNSSAETDQEVYSTFSEMVETLNTPDDVYSWMVNNIDYREDVVYSDEFREAEYTYDLRYGDCDDFAKFADYILKEHGYETSIISVYSAGKGHTICVWKDGQGKYNYLSNTGIRHIAAVDLQKVADDLNNEWKVYSVYPSKEGIPKENS